MTAPCACSAAQATSVYWSLPTPPEAMALAHGLGGPREGASCSQADAWLVILLGAGCKHHEQVCVRARLTGEEEGVPSPTGALPASATFLPNDPVLIHHFPSSSAPCWYCFRPIPPFLFPRLRRS